MKLRRMCSLAGNKSLDALRTYERSNDTQHQAVSQLLTSSSSNTTDQFLPTTQFSHSSFNLITSKTSAISLQGCTINIISAPNTSIGNLMDKEFQDFNPVRMLKLLLIEHTPVSKEKI